MKIFSSISTFFQETIWKKPNSKKGNRFFYPFFRVSYLATKGLVGDNGFDKASTLTYYALLAIVPLIAIAFGIAQHLGFYHTVSEWIESALSSQPEEVAQKLTQFASSTLQNTQGGIMAAIGFGILCWTVINTLREIEGFFDQIWNVKKARSLWQQIKIYLPMVLFFPIFIVISSSVTVYLHNLSILQLLGPVLVIILNAISYLINWFVLTLLYKYLPNTNVDWKAAGISAFIVVIINFIWQWVYVTFQVGAASYGAIYGSFAAFPLFLVWLYYSWLIFIFGSELSYHIQKDSSDYKTSR